MSAKILIYDIETTPNIGYTWGKWQQNVIQFVQESHLLCVSYKWLGDKRTKVIAQTDYSGYEKDRTCDKRLCKDLWSLLDEADVTIAHNGNSFDNKKARTRLVVNGFKPPSPFQSIDTLKIARGKFKFNCNKLDSLGKILGVGRKVPHPGFSLWLGCMAGEEKSWCLMKKYARGDVDLLEDVYKTLRPWADGGPNLGLFEEDSALCCPACGADTLIKRGFQKTKTQSYRRFNCKTCFRWCRAAHCEKGKGSGVR